LLILTHKKIPLRLIVKGKLLKNYGDIGERRKLYESLSIIDFSGFGLYDFGKLIL